MINKEKASLLAELHNGDIVRITTSSTQKKITRCSWIDTVKTSRAKSSMRANCNHRIRAIDTQSGINILSFIFRLNVEKIGEILREEGLDEQFYRIAREYDFLKEVIHRIEEGLRETSRFGTFWSRKRFVLKSSVFASIEVLSNQSVSDAVFDYCCHPKSGDEIVGFMFEGKAHIHHKMCKHAAVMMEKNEPMVFVRWMQQQFNRYHLIISMPNAQGSLAELLTYMAKMGADINSIELGKEKSEHTQYCEMEFQTLENDLNRLKSKLEKKGKIIQFFRTDDAYRSQG